MKRVDYTTVTEITGAKVTAEQIQRMYTRYRFASEFCKDKEILEVACGSGQGLGYLARKAKKVVGGDIDENNLKLALKHYKNRSNIELKVFDAHNLPFEDNSFDVVILYEAIYYLAEPEKFIKEAKRVLKKNGCIIISTANKDWAGFNPSPYSHKYFSANELSSLLEDSGFCNIQIFGDCPVITKTLKAKIISMIKIIAVKLHLIPKTMKAKEILKRIFMGKLVSLPPEITDGMTEYIQPIMIANNVPNPWYKVLFAVGFNR